MIPAMAAPMTASPPTAPPTAAPTGKGLDVEEEVIAVVVGLAAAEPAVGNMPMIAAEPVAVVPATPANPGGAAVPVEVAVIVISGWVLTINVLVTCGAFEVGMAGSVTLITDI